MSVVNGCHTEECHLCFCCFQYIEKLEDRKLTICGAEVEVRCLEGDEEAEFLEKAKNEINRSKEHCEYHRMRKGMYVYFCLIM
jgi:hypothetical protein